MLSLNWQQEDIPGLSKFGILKWTYKKGAKNNREMPNGGKW